VREAPTIAPATATIPENNTTYPDSTCLIAAPVGLGPNEAVRSEAVTAKICVKSEDKKQMKSREYELTECTFLRDELASLSLLGRRTIRLKALVSGAFIRRREADTVEVKAV
jgi:hypothetical protein